VLFRPASTNTAFNELHTAAESTSAQVSEVLRRLNKVERGCPDRQYGGRGRDAPA